MPLLTYDPFPQCLQQSPLTPLLLARVTSEEVGAIYQTLSVSTSGGCSASPPTPCLANSCTTSHRNASTVSTDQSSPRLPDFFLAGKPTTTSWSNSRRVRPNIEQAWCRLACIRECRPGRSYH